MLNFLVGLCLCNLSSFLASKTVYPVCEVRARHRMLFNKFLESEKCKDFIATRRARWIFDMSKEEFEEWFCQVYEDKKNLENALLEKYNRKFSDPWSYYRIDGKFGDYRLAIKEMTKRHDKSKDGKQMNDYLKALYENGLEVEA